MAAISGFPSPTIWSSCSVDDLQDGLNNENLDRCLTNEPTVTVGDPVCGNGIREGDELCDCGSASVSFQCFYTQVHSKCPTGPDSIRSIVHMLLVPLFLSQLTQECTDPCCNANTCQLAAGAQCAAGDCCQPNCQFRPYETTCRASTGECDITEYCTGDSSECPEDAFLQDGSECDNDQAYCYAGTCVTHDDQCQFHFGSGTCILLYRIWCFS